MGASIRNPLFVRLARNAAFAWAMFSLLLIVLEVLDRPAEGTTIAIVIAYVLGALLLFGLIARGLHPPRAYRLEADGIVLEPRVRIRRDLRNVKVAWNDIDRVHPVGRRGCESRVLVLGYNQMRSERVPASQMNGPDRVVQRIHFLVEATPETWALIAPHVPQDKSVNLK